MDSKTAAKRIIDVNELRVNDVPIVGGKGANLGVMLTCNQYEGGYYTAKEASIIATLFSAVSITFTLVVLDTVGMLDKFGIYYLIVCLVGIVCAIICKSSASFPPLCWHC